MANSTDGSEMDQIIEQLASEAKTTRRAVLFDLKKKTESKETSSLFRDLFDPLVKVVSSDPVDSLRETASVILLDLVFSGNLTAQQFQTIIKLGDQRIGVEPSEEIRLTLAKIIHSAVINQNSQQVFLENLDGLTQLLKVVVRDRYGEIVKEACEIIIALSEKNDHFRLQADYFVEPLLQNLKTQSMKVRIPCTKALEPVMIYSPLTIPNITPQLEKSWSESSPSLKLAVVQAVGNVSKELELDDQNFHCLLPIILLGKCNDFSEVSNVADDMWNHLKNQSDFNSQFIGKCFSKLLPRLLQDAEDWNNDIRVQTAQLMYQFLYELSSRTTDLSVVMEIITFQAGDQEAPVRNWAWRSARLVGETSAQEALEWLSKREVTHSDVTIYSNIIRGFLQTHSHSPSTLDLSVQLAVKFSSVKDISLLECLEALLEKDFGIGAEPMNQLLSVALSLEGEKESDLFLSRQIGVLERLAFRLNYADVDTMIRQRLPVLWTNFEEPIDKWTTSTLSWKILQFVANDMKIVNDYVFDLIRQTIVSSSSPEIKLKCFNMLTASMEKVECDPANLEVILLTNIKWKPGRSASVLRSCAALCTYAAITHRKLDITQSNINVFTDCLLPLVEDEVVNTRLAAIRILKRCLLIGRPTKLDSVLTTLMGRLNDVSKDVRHGVMSGLKDVFLLWRQQNSSHQMEKKFIELVRVLSRDDDLPSKTFAEGILKSMLEESVVNLDQMKIN